MNTVTLERKLTDKDKKELLKEILGKSYNNSGQNFRIFSNVIDYVGYTDTTLTLAELIPAANVYISGNAVISFAASGATVLSIALFPVAAMISVINAYQTGHKHYSLRAIAYTVTAWAFNKPVPVSSPRILRNIRSGIYVRGNSVENEYNKVWRNTSKEVIRILNSQAAIHKTSKAVLQLVFRAMVDNNEKKLCSLILKGFEKDLQYIEKRIWRSTLTITYPQ